MATPVWCLNTQRVLRISAQAHNCLTDYERLAKALTAELTRERQG